MYFFTGIRIVPEPEYDDINKLYYNGRCKKYVFYAGLNVKFFVKCLMDNKSLKDGKLKSLMDTSNYKDAIMWDARVIGENCLLASMRLLLNT